MKMLWRLIWNVSETLDIPLGRYAPFVFGKMLGKEGKRIDIMCDVFNCPSECEGLKK